MAYKHTKFYSLLRLNFVSFLCKQLAFINETFATNAGNNCEPYSIYRTCIAYTEGEISEVINVYINECSLCT